MKRGILFVTCFLLLTSFTLSMGGVSPGIIKMDFEPYLEKEFQFSFIFGKGVKSEAYISAGKLQEYFKIIKEENFLGRKIVTIKMKLPSEIEKPGINKVRVGAKEAVSDGDGVGIIMDVGAIIEIRVPYPGKYAELSLKAPNANAGEDIKYYLTVFSRGSDSITIFPILELKNNGGLIEKITLDSKTIATKDETTYSGIIKTTNYKPGNYNLTAIVDYGGERLAEVTSLFRLGELKVILTNYSKTLPYNKIGRLELKIASLWNEPIKDVYATVKIIEYPNRISESPTSNLNPWEEQNKMVFIDTIDIEEEEIHLEIVIHYADGKTTTEIVKIKLIKPTDNLFTIIVIGGIVALFIIILIVIILVLIFKRKKDGKKNKKKDGKKNK